MKDRNIHDRTLEFAKKKVSRLLRCWILSDVGDIAGRTTCAENCSLFFVAEIVFIIEIFIASGSLFNCCSEIDAANVNGQG